MVRRFSAVLVAVLTASLLSAPLTAIAAAPAASVRIDLSVDGTNYLSDLIGANAVNPGQLIYVRLNYDNFGDRAGEGVTIRTLLPQPGFAFVSNTTRNCITPSGSEKVCNTDAEQAGAIPNSVWTSPFDLHISPTAGLYDVSPSQVSGILETGKKRYLNFLDCDYHLTNGWNTDDIFGFEPGNSQITSLPCGPGPDGTFLRPAHSSRQVVDLLARRYVNMLDCDYILTNGLNTDDIVGFGPSNIPLSMICGESVDPAFKLRPAHSSIHIADHLGMRYLNFLDCDYIDLGTGNTDDIIGMAPANAPLSFSCGSANLRPQHSFVDPLDILDTARGKGYIEFRMTAGQVPGIYTELLGMQGSHLAPVTDTAQIEIKGQAEEQNPQCSDGVDNADPEDTLSDFNDPGCYTNGVYNPNDNDETNQQQLPQCSDGVDNADPEDTLSDFNDPGCYTNGIYNPNDNDETNQTLPQCSDGQDNDGDGKIDMQDPGCSTPQDNDETNPNLPQCSDGVDNDGDGKIDYFDPGCYPNGVFDSVSYNPNDNDESNVSQPQQCRWTRVNNKWVRTCQ